MNITSPEKRVLIYGDSITWGRIAKQTGRYDGNTRWTYLLQKHLGEGIEIIEEGLRARMLSGENPYFKDRDGLKQFGPIFGSHLPVDLVVIFLGTNDMNKEADKSPRQIAESLSDYFAVIYDWSKELQFAMLPEVLLISPPLIDESRLKGDTMFTGAEAKSKELAPLYETVAKSQGAYFFDAAGVVTACEEDGVHLNIGANAALAEKLAPAVRDILAVG